MFRVNNKTLELSKKYVKGNNKDNRTPFDNVVLVYLFLSLMFHILF